MQIPLNKRVEKFKRFYSRSNDKPLLGFFVESEYPLIRYPASADLPEGQPLAPDDFDVEAFLPDYERLYELHEYVGGDFIFAASSFWGIPWLEAALGCEIYASHSTGSIYAKHPEDFDGLIPEYSSSNKWVKKGVEFLSELAKQSGGRYPLATPRLRGISDLLACLYGDENLIFKFYEQPDQINTLCSKLTDFSIGFITEQLKMIPDFYGGVGSFYYNCWAPSQTVWLQEDASSILSPSLFEQFILPCVQRQLKAFNGIMHMHPTGFYPYKQLLDTDILALELHIDQGGPSAEQLYDIHKQILGKKPLIIWGAMSEEDLDWMFSKLPPQGLAIFTAIDEQQVKNKEYERLYRKYKQ